MYKGKNVTSVAFFCAKSIKLAELFAKTCTCQKIFVTSRTPTRQNRPTSKIRSHFAGHIGKGGDFF